MKDNSNKFIAGICFALVGLPVLCCVRDIALSLSNMVRTKIEVPKAKSDLELTKIDDEIRFYNEMDDIVLDIVDENGRDY